MDTPEARAAGTGTRRKGHPSLARGELAANKKGAKREVIPIVFLDESGFMLQPVRRSTWAPSGKTPQQDAWDRHDRLSVIGLIGISPLRRRLSLYFTFQPENVQTEHMVWLLRQLHYHYRSKVILVWDRLRVHLSAAACFEEHHPDWFQFEWLPAYSPELNPVEQCWNHTKYADLPNFIPDDVDHLGTAVHESMLEQREDQRLLRSHFAYAKLPL
jgi:transposase